MAGDKDPNDPNQRLTRSEAMDVVQKNRMKRLYEKEIDEVPQTPETVAAAPDPDVDLDPEKQVVTQTETPLVLSDDELSKYMVRTKVRGEERTVPLAELRASAQKNEAADDYLRDAKEQARQILEEAKAKAATPAAPAPVATPSEVPADADRMVDEAVDKIFVGEVDEAKRLLKEALKGRPATPAPAPDVNVDQIAASVEQKVVVRSALRQFAKDYPAIYADPIARKVADDFLTEATAGKPLEAFPEERIGTILNETGKRVLDWTRGLAGVPANGKEATTRLDKEVRKEAIDELPTAATRATTVVPQPKTTADVILAMKAARGQMRDPTET